ncbi:MAG: hypothetical protein J6J01_01760 [Oscillospiraceae bacterium]|nr:hypothetical protein [Oscillospiraceae bacterium]MBP3698196.1 hypothetical protein [Oscillospiraceae bacterium]
MLDKKEYRSFTGKLSRVLDDCKVLKDEISERRYFDDTGFWEDTKHIHYYFDVEKIQLHEETYKEDILSICRDLPKIEKDFPGFGGVISSTALLCNPTTRTLFMYQAMKIDEFSILLEHLHIGLRIPIETDGGQVFIIGIFEEYKDQIQ